jgi:lipid-binding SYLF domain-containing protein
MTRLLRMLASASLVATVVACSTTDGSNVASMNTASLERDAKAALNSLYEKTPAARSLGANASGILIFPHVTKAGLVVGAQGGDGVLIRGGRAVGYYNTGGVSVGLQAGAQEYGYALFFMSDAALRYLENTRGWEIGVGPSVVVVDAGAARNLTTTTAQSDIYAFIFDQKGLMAGMGLQGTKITQLR